jgi:hypothetical protein
VRRDVERVFGFRGERLHSLFGTDLFHSG